MKMRVLQFFINNLPPKHTTNVARHYNTHNQHRTPWKERTGSPYMGYNRFGLFLIMACISLKVAVAAASACNYSAQTCGGMSIPYPFGMSSECGRPEYRISCKLNSSYGDGCLPFLQVGTAFTSELQVLNFSTNSMIVNSTYLKAMPTADAGCRLMEGVASFELPTDRPFVVGPGNLFAVIGCNSSGSCIAPKFSVNCSTGCYNEYDFAFCNTYACCNNPLPPGSRYLNFTGKGIAYSAFPDVCGFSTILSPSTYDSSSKSGIFAAGHYGLNISWALNSTQNCSMAKLTADYACSDHAACLDDSTVAGYTCNCIDAGGFRGDGYKDGIGCYDIDECQEHLDNCERPPLGNCINTVGSYNCSCAIGTTGSGLRGSCVHADKTDIVVPTVLGGLAGAFILTIFIIIVCGSRRAYRRKQQKEDNFNKNRGPELRSMLFTEDELRRATNNFSREHELGRGGYGTVYWGNLPKHGKVAIKKAKHMEDADREEDQMRSFVSEILLLGKTTHENVVRLLGCCVETRVPLLVYEFVENGTLWDHLHPQGNSQPGLSWARRLHIAVGTATALDYLHKMSPPILHRDIKSPNILIDKSYNAKVADFGASRFLTSGATHLTFAAVVGTRGYLDPQYSLSSQFTDKSDVYSFGVILLELISAMPADLGTTLGTLAHHFQTQYRMGGQTDLIDSRLSTNPNILASIQDVAELAMHCLAMEGYRRPTIEVVLGELKGIQAKRMLLDEVGGSYTSGTGEHLMCPIAERQSAGNSDEHENASLLDPSWSQASHQSETTITTTSSNSEIALISLNFDRN